MTDIRKVVLAYSGGLDTSIILKWLQERYGCEVVTFTADLGQGEELEPARRKAEALGAVEIHVEDLREEFARDFVFPMFRANAIYEGEYLLGTSIARPLIAKHLVDIAARTGADAVAHGATGKGNDQVRFELGAYALNPDIRIIAPWREWDLHSREQLLTYAADARHPHRAQEQQRVALLHGREPAAHLVRRQRAGGPRDGAGRGDVALDPVPGGCAGHPALHRAHLPARGRRRHRRGGARRRRGDRAAERDRRRARHRPHRHRREPLRGHEVPRLLRDPGRHHHAARPPRHRVHHPRPRGRPPQGRADAPLRPHHLQRLLVESGTDDAAGADRRVPAPRQRDGPAQALQGQRAGGRAEARIRTTCSTPPSRRSRTTGARTTRRTPRASSGSTRCGCAPRRGAGGGSGGLAALDPSSRRPARRR